MTGLFGLLAGIVGVIGYIPYIRDILRHTTKPERASWTIWSLEYTVLFFAQLSAGATSTLWLVGLQLLAVLIVAGLSVRYGTGRFTRRNKLLVVCVCLSLLAWYVAQSAALAIYIALAIEMSGVALTSIKVYRQPGSETLTTWWLFAVAGLLGILAVASSSADILYVYPISLIVMSLMVVTAASLGTKREVRDTTDLDLDVS